MGVALEASGLGIVAVLRRNMREMGGGRLSAAVSATRLSALGADLGQTSQACEPGPPVDLGMPDESLVEVVDQAGNDVLAGRDVQGGLHPSEHGSRV